MSLAALTWAKRQTIGDPLAKLVLLCLSDATNAHHGYSFPSQARLAEECECSRQTVSAKLKLLEERGLIRRERMTDKTGRDIGCRYHLLGVNDGDTGVKEDDTGVNDDDRGVSTTTTPGVNHDDTSKDNRKGNRKREPEQRGTRFALTTLPDDWADWARQKGHPDPDAEFEKFRDWWAAAPGQRGVKSDWPATWRMWIRRAFEKGDVVPVAPSSSPPAAKRPTITLRWSGGDLPNLRGRLRSATGSGFGVWLDRLVPDAPGVTSGPEPPEGVMAELTRWAGHYDVQFERAA